MDDELVVERRDRVGYVTIDRQARRNAIGQAHMERLVEIFDDFDRADDVWVVMVTGAGDEAFSAGRDLKELRDRDRAGVGANVPMRGTVRNVFEAVYECRKPVIAALNGWAVGGGLELAIACDLRIAAAHTRLAVPEAKRGMGANFASHMLPRLVPLGIANQMLYFGEAIDAETAARWGLVNEVIPTAEFRAGAERYVRKLLRSAPLTLRRYKAGIQKGRELPLSAALRLDAAPDPYHSDDRIEGVRAFAEKREPQWRAR